jgi:chromosomal replication initiation ATPase DnaA
MKCQRSDAFEDLKTLAHVVKGDERFARNAFEIAAHPEERRRAWTVEQIARTVAGRAGLELEEMRGRALSFERARTRATIGYVAWKQSRIPLTKVAEFFHRHGTTLVRDVRRFEADLESREGLREELASILQELDRS